MGKRSSSDKRQPLLFDPSELPIADLPAEPALKPIDYPVWTQNKAQLIMRYLRYFVYITRHGTYIDGFAGPQEEQESECWAAKLVLNSDPKWLRHFHLCDESKSQVNHLRRLKADQPTRDSRGNKLNRDITIYRGDFNDKVDEVLASGDITEKEATFCLLDQRTFECDWETVRKLGQFKKKGNKIELFYFLANSWLERALSGQKDMGRLARWWGADDWTRLKLMSRQQRQQAMVERMKRDLGYKSVKAWPIYQREGGAGIVMYYMIHATDHPEGPKLMWRAYRNAVQPLEPAEQLAFELEGHPEPEKVASNG
jgi:three-Cys-motif partner protein